MYVSFKLGELVYVIGERVGENVMCGCRCVGWLRLWPSIVLHWWLCCCGGVCVFSELSVMDRDVGAALVYVLVEA